MRLRSRGLGRKELVMDFREYEVVREGDELVVVGTIRDPVNWDFTIRICEDDVPGILNLTTRPSMLSTLARALFKRRKSHHWSGDYEEHVSEGKKRRKSARESAKERARACMEMVAPRRAVRSKAGATPETSKAGETSAAGKA
jgi:hypothetical protein